MTEEMLEDVYRQDTDDGSMDTRIISKREYDGYVTLYKELNDVVDTLKDDEQVDAKDKMNNLLTLILEYERSYDADGDSDIINSQRQGGWYERKA